jgi:hypothetical protein
MAFSAPFTAVSGAVFTAAQWNTSGRDNINALWPGTTAGDIDYYSSATAKTRIPIGIAGTFLGSNASVPSWGPLVLRREGGSATIWTNPGTTAYTPTATVIQSGYIAVTFAASAGSATSITYPVAFAQRPAIYISAETAYTLAYMWSFGHTDDTVNGFNLNVKWSSAYTGTISFGWLAIGQ